MSRGHGSRTDSSAELPVEGLHRPARVVEPEEDRLDPALRERGQQREQMPFGPADPPDPVEVDDPHATGRGASAAP